jgi:hypothetical protein
MYRMTGLATVATFLAQMGTEIAERMTAWLRDVLEPGETMPDVAFLLTLVQRKLEQARERLRAKDNRLSRAVAAFHKALRVRDRAAEKMRGVLIHARELLDGCTPESAAPAKFRGRISQRWLTAWRQADAFRDLLRDPGFRPVPRPGLLPYPKAELDQALVESMNEVAYASQAIARAEQEVVSARARLKKDQAETARIHRWTLQLVQALSFLADAPELVHRLPPTLREEAAKKNRRKKKKEPAKALESGSGLDLQPDTSLESGPASTLQAETSEKSGTQSTLRPDTSEESGPLSILQAETSEESGTQSTLQRPQGLPGGNRRLAPPARGVRTEELPPVTPVTPRESVETPADGPPNAAAVRRNNDICRVHVAPLRGNRRRSGSVRGGDRAKRWLVASSGGGDRRSEGPEPAENVGFQAPRPWKAKIFALFGR